jgi:hypothetical protein
MAEMLYVISSQLIKFILADKFVLSMPLQHKFANRYSQYYPTESTKKYFELVVLIVNFDL